MGCNMEKVIILDTRNQKDAFVEKSFKDLGFTIIRSKLPFGDVALPTNILNCVDLKSSGGGLIEVARNRCSKDHNRMKREIESCLNCGGKITFVCFEPGMSEIEDIANWKIPCFKSDLYKKVVTKDEDGNEKTETICLHKKGQPMTKVNPITLMKSIQTMTTEDHYKNGTKVDFVFATKENCADIIIKILNKEKEKIWS